MKPINNWERVKAAGSYETLPAGGYICRIRAAKEVANKRSPGTHLEILFDIADGEHKGFFEKDYRSQTGEDKFWRGIINQNVPLESSPKYETQCSFFRSFTDAVEDSNPGYRWAWDETSLRDKLCGIVFGEREKQSQRGTVYVVTNAERVISVEDVKAGKFKVPERKKLESAAAPTGSASWADTLDDDLPL